MKYKVLLTDTFQKTVKILSKKYRNVKKDLKDTIQKIEKDPTIGDPIPGWKKEIWKVRSKSSDVRKGKRGGFRLIYLWKAEEKAVYMLAAYLKGEKQEISKKEIEEILKKLNQKINS